MEKLAYADSQVAINSYLSRTGAWELSSSPVKRTGEAVSQDGMELKRKVKAGENEVEMETGR